MKKTTNDCYCLLIVLYEYSEKKLWLTISFYLHHILSFNLFFLTNLAWYQALNSCSFVQFPNKTHQWKAFGAKIDCKLLYLLMEFCFHVFASVFSSLSLTLSAHRNLMNILIFGNLQFMLYYDWLYNIRRFFLWKKKILLWHAIS